MQTVWTAREVLDRCYLEARARLLDVAATLDRIERAPGADEVRTDPRLKLISDALRLLADGQPDRAERILMLFSLPHDPNWGRRSA